MMSGRAMLLCRSLAGRPGVTGAGRLLLAASLALLMSLATAPAQAQTPRLAISEVQWEFQGRDATREYWEVANLGDTPWDPNDHWLFRARYRDDDATTTPHLFIRLFGLQPVPPNGVLQIEWGRPLAEGNDTTDTGCNPGPNVFCTGRDGFNSTDLDQHMALAIFAKTANNSPPTLESGTMLCYYVQGDLNYTGEGMTKALIGHDKAVASKLWTAGSTFIQDDPDNPEAVEWSKALRMGPGGYPAGHGTKASDYYRTLVGIPSLDAEGFDVVSPPAPAPLTKNRAGTIAQPNYLHPGAPIPGQIMAGFYSIRNQAVMASLSANGPASAVQVAGLNRNGEVATTLWSSNTWSPIARLTGAPAADDLALVNNPVRGSRTLIIRAKADGSLAASTATSGPEFSPPVALGLKAQFAPAMAVDAQGNEHYVAVEAGTGAIMENVNAGGTLRGWQAIPGVTTNAPAAAAFGADPAGLSVAAFNGSQLVLTRLGADGKFGAWQNVGDSLAERPAGIGPVLAWNASTKRLEIFALAGNNEAAELRHAEAELPARDQTKIGALNKIGEINTNAPPGVAVNADTGQVRLLARGGGKEPGLSPIQELASAYGDAFAADPGDPQSGFVWGTTFEGNAWSPAARVGVARLPGPSKASLMFKTPVAPVTLYDANTKQYRDLLIGEDAQIYHNALQ